jgi:hypothetical protein
MMGRGGGGLEGGDMSAKNEARVGIRAVLCAALAAAACGVKSGDGSDAGEPEASGSAGASSGSTTAPQGGSTSAAGGSEGAGGSTGGPGMMATDEEGSGAPPVYFDVASLPDGGGSGCVAPPQVSCDHLDDDPWHAFSLNCPGGPEVDGTITLTGPEQLYVHDGNLGTYAPPPFPPREGDKFVILSSGAAEDLTMAGLFASTSIGFGATPLPAPIQTTMVSATDDCYDDPGLVGTGDCSNTIQAQWDQGNGSFDYAEMRLSATVPAGTLGFTYDFAMFSTEYPDFYQTQYNDMYIAWLESEQWTGNVSFDDMGHPISLNAGFLDYKDAPNDFDCPAPCEAPELEGTAMEGHAGTRWLTTTAGVTPGETIELVLGVFDLSDSVLDTVILLDNFQWACEGGAPVTIPG